MEGIGHNFRLKLRPKTISLHVEIVVRFVHLCCGLLLLWKVFVYTYIDPVAPIDRTCAQ